LYHPEPQPGYQENKVRDCLVVPVRLTSRPLVKKERDVEGGHLADRKSPPGSFLRRFLPRLRAASGIRRRCLAAPVMKEYNDHRAERPRLIAGGVPAG
jgi:hypothetical protein